MEIPYAFVWALLIHLGLIILVGSAYQATRSLVRIEAVLREIKQLLEQTAASTPKALDDSEHP